MLSWLVLGLVVWHLWIGRVKNPGLGPPNVAVEVFNVGSWLTHGEFALEVDVDFLAVVEHRLIPARVRSEWSRLRAEGLALCPLWPQHSSGGSLIVVVRLGVCFP